MKDVISWLSRDLPRQTAVYVAFDTREEKVHVVSMDVSAKYSVVRSMQSDLEFQLAADNDDDSGLIAVGDGSFATPEQHSLLQHTNQLRQSGHYEGDDKAGFYNGVPGRVLMSHFCPQRDLVGLEKLDLMTLPYARYDIPEDVLREEMGFVPESRDGMCGPVELVGGGESGRLSVSMNTWFHPSVPYVVAKLDLQCCLMEHDFQWDFVSFEQVLSSQMNSDELEKVRNSAVNLMGWMANNYNGQEPLDPVVREVICQSSVSQWPVQMHDHVVVDA